MEDLLVRLGPGAILGALVMLILEELRWRRLMRTRWDDHRLRTYAGFTGAVNRTYFWWSWTLSGPPRNLWSNLDRIAATGEDLVDLMGEINVLASDRTQEAADGLAQALTSIIELLTDSVEQKSVLGGFKLSEDLDLEDFQVALRVKRGEFASAVQAELGIRTRNSLALADPLVRAMGRLKSGLLARGGHR